MKRSDCHPQEKHFCKGLCRSCYNRKWKAEHPDYRLQWNKAHPNYDRDRVREWRSIPENKQKQREREITRYAKHRLTILERQKQYRLKDPEGFRQRQKALLRLHPERGPKYSSKWRRNNLPKAAELQFRRRARLAAVSIEDCSSKVALIRKTRFCHWCCVRLTPETVTVDHVIPITRGGTHCSDNLVASCRTCNSSKGDKLISEWKWRMAA